MVLVANFQSNPRSFAYDLAQFKIVLESPINTRGFPTCIRAKLYLFGLPRVSVNVIIGANMGEKTEFAPILKKK